VTAGPRVAIMEIASRLRHVIGLLESISQMLREMGEAPAGTRSASLRSHKFNCVQINSIDVRAANDDDYSWRVSINGGQAFRVSRLVGLLLAALASVDSPNATTIPFKSGAKLAAVVTKHLGATWKEDRVRGRLTELRRKLALQTGGDGRQLITFSKEAGGYRLMAPVSVGKALTQTLDRLATTSVPKIRAASSRGRG